MPTPLTVEFIGTRLATITTADPPANVTATKIAGGGGSPSEQQGSLQIQGAGSAGMTYPTASRFCTLTYDIVGAGLTALDFNAGGAEENQLLWVWGNALLAPTSTGTTTAGAIGGFGIVLSDSTNIANSWAEWTFFGAENYPGGWQKMVIDPSIRPTASGGTFAASSLASIRAIGVYFVSDNNARGGADGALLDSFEVGSGLRVFGSGTDLAGFTDILAADEGVATSGDRFGVIKSLEATDTILQLKGYLEIGSDAAAGTVFSDINKIITLDNPQYIATDGTTRYANSIPTTFQQINIVGNPTSGTEVLLGIKVGEGDSARGRNGITFLGNEDYSIGLAIEDESNVNVKMYGTTIRGFSEEITWPASSGHEFIGCTLDGSAQFDAGSGVQIRNSTFQNYSGIDASVIWNSGFDIKNSSFIANLDSGAIEHPFSGAFIYDNLQFSENDYDINFSLQTSGTLLIQATNTANPGTAISGNADSIITIENTVLLTLTDIVIGSEVRIYKSETTDELAGIENEDDGTFEYAYNFTGDFSADIVVMNLDYKYFRQEDNILTTTPSTIKIVQQFDRNYDNPT